MMFDRINDWVERRIAAGFARAIFKLAGTNDVLALAKAEITVGKWDVKIEMRE